MDPTITAINSTSPRSNWTKEHDHYLRGLSQTHDDKNLIDRLQIALSSPRHSDKKAFFFQVISDLYYEETKRAKPEYAFNESPLHVPSLRWW